MTIGVVVQARVSSTRLPGKVLRPLLGEPMILRQLERLARVNSASEIIVATSSDPSDDELARVVQSGGFPVFRGSLDNVLERFIGATRSIGVDTVVRVTGDCPLIDPVVLDECVALFELSETDYVSNTHPATFPDGLDVEVTRLDVLERVLANAVLPAELEHVTWGIWNRTSEYRLANVESRVNMSHHRWTVDTIEDFEFVEWVYASLYPNDPAFATQRIIKLLEECPERIRTDEVEQRNSAIAHLTLEE